MVWYPVISFKCLEKIKIKYRSIDTVLTYDFMRINDKQKEKRVKILVFVEE